MSVRKKRSTTPVLCEAYLNQPFIDCKGNEALARAELKEPPQNEGGITELTLPISENGRMLSQVARQARDDNLLSNQLATIPPTSEKGRKEGIKGERGRQLTIFERASLCSSSYARILAVDSMPSINGICESIQIRLGRNDLKSSSAWTPFSASTNSIPFVLRKVARILLWTKNEGLEWAQQGQDPRQRFDSQSDRVVVHRQDAYG
jgi:hypothetical protein